MINTMSSKIDSIQLGEEEGQLFKISVELEVDLKAMLIAYLRKKDVFTWGPLKMTSIDLEVTTHKINVNP